MVVAMVQPLTLAVSPAATAVVSSIGCGVAVYVAVPSVVSAIGRLPRADLRTETD